MKKIIGILVGIILIVGMINVPKDVHAGEPTMDVGHSTLTF
ncbi:hypothetical protein [Lederbergia sp. NSJ-179]|nr:hypothetical protein [Lederbergia sp. NSJ-179]